jgi:hypothetical protein
MPGAPAPRPEFEAILRQVAELTREEQRILLDRVLRQLLGDRPESEHGLYNPDGTSYLFLVPPALRRRLWETPEFVAEMDRRSRTPGQATPLSEVIARLESLPQG